MFKASPSIRQFLYVKKLVFILISVKIYNITVAIMVHYNITVAIMVH
jgi:hypothetical protein